LQVQWTNKAKRRLEEIEAYIGQESPVAAAKVIQKTATQLSKYPDSGKPGRLMGTRELLFSDSPYLVVYTVRNNIVTILTIFHTAQKFDSDAL
jgi:addiction module RelE/StbE family toxin